MRIFVLFKISLFVLFLGGYQTAHAASNCTYTNGAVDVAAVALDSNGKDRNCNFTPDSVKLKLFDIYLCEDLPTYANYRSACNNLFSSGNGKDVEITNGGTTSLMDGSVTLAEGEYKYAALVIENAFSIKFQSDYSLPIRGRTGVGNTCWTNGNDVKIFYNSYTDFSSECGASANANPQFSKYTYNGLYHAAFPSNPFKNAIDGISAGFDLSAYLLSNLETMAVVTPDSNDPTNQNLVVDDGAYILGIFKFPTTQTVDPLTKNVDMGVSVDKVAFMKLTTSTLYADGSGPICNSGGNGSLAPHATSGAYSCLSTSYPNSLKFKFEVN